MQRENRITTFVNAFRHCHKDFVLYGVYDASSGYVIVSRCWRKEREFFFPADSNRYRFVRDAETAARKQIDTWLAAGEPRILDELC